MKLEEAIKECKKQISHNDIDGNPLLPAHFRDAALSNAEYYKYAYNKQIS